MTLPFWAAVGLCLIPGAILVTVLAYALHRLVTIFVRSWLETGRQEPDACAWMIEELADDAPPQVGFTERAEEAERLIKTGRFEVTPLYRGRPRA